MQPLSDKWNNIYRRLWKVSITENEPKCNCQKWTPENLSWPNVHRFLCFKNNFPNKNSKKLFSLNWTKQYHSQVSQSPTYVALTYFKPHFLIPYLIPNSSNTTSSSFFQPANTLFKSWLLHTAVSLGSAELSRSMSLKVAELWTDAPCSARTEKV